MALVKGSGEGMALMASWDSTATRVAAVAVAGLFSLYDIGWG